MQTTAELKVSGIVADADLNRHLKGCVEQGCQAQYTAKVNGEAIGVQGTMTYEEQVAAAIAVIQVAASTETPSEIVSKANERAIEFLIEMGKSLDGIGYITTKILDDLQS